jgi:hypothetical protein
VTPESFAADLAEKNWAVLLRSADGALAGFSTILAYERPVGMELATIVYSGDTIMARSARGTAALPRTWIAAVNDIRSAHGDRRCLWLLITSGFRTYRFLPVFWRDFYPRYDRPTPRDMQR